MDITTQFITPAELVCTFKNCNFTFDPDLIDTVDEHGGVGTGWRYAPDTGEEVGPHEHQLPDHIDL
jgi:hypothetical protein